MLMDFFAWVTGPNGGRLRPCLLRDDHELDSLAMRMCFPRPRLWPNGSIPWMGMQQHVSPTPTQVYTASISEVSLESGRPA